MGGRLATYITTGSNMILRCACRDPMTFLHRASISSRRLDCLICFPSVHHLKIENNNTAEPAQKLHGNQAIISTMGMQLFYFMNSCPLKQGLEMHHPAYKYWRYICIYTYVEFGHDAPPVTLANQLKNLPPSFSSTRRFQSYHRKHILMPGAVF